MELSDRLARIERAADDDPRTQRDLEVVRRQMARLEGRLVRIAKSRSNWTRLGALQAFIDDDEAA